MKKNSAFLDLGKQAKQFNDLARKKMQEKILQDILVDLTICELEGWCKLEYINELKDLLNSINIRKKP